MTDEIAPGYNKIIDQPMDLGTILRRLSNRSSVNSNTITEAYSIREMDRDMQLMFENSLKYNIGNEFFLNVRLLPI